MTSDSFCLRDDPHGVALGGPAVRLPAWGWRPAATRIWQPRMCSMGSLGASGYLSAGAPIPTA
jgi:hypothetical protein